MTRAIRTICTVRPDGSIVVPVGVEEAGRDVEVTIIPLTPTKRAADMTEDEYAAFIDAIAGQWVGEWPEAPDPPPEARDPL
jgi:hypothetical protein